MFDTTNINIQACSGGIYKSHPKSRIMAIPVSDWDDSTFKNMLFSRTPRLDDREVVVLQVVNSIKERVLVEYMFKEDFEKVFP